MKGYQKAIYFGKSKCNCFQNDGVTKSNLILETAKEKINSDWNMNTFHGNTQVWYPCSSIPICVILFFLFDVHDTSVIYLFDTSMSFESYWLKYLRKVFTASRMCYKKFKMPITSRSGPLVDYHEIKGFL